MICAKCRTKNADNSRFCIGCGTPLQQKAPSQVRIPNTGINLQSENIFIEKIGEYKIGNKEAKKNYLLAGVLVIIISVICVFYNYDKYQDYSKFHFYDNDLETKYGIYFWLSIFAIFLGIHLIQMSIVLGKKQKILIFSDHVEGLQMTPILLFIRQQRFFAKYSEIVGCRIEDNNIILTSVSGSWEIIVRNKILAEEIYNAIIVQINRQ